MGKQKKYQEQLERVGRFYERFRQIEEGITISRPTIYLEDEAYAFFIFCYQLKDWIKNDDALPLNVRNKAEDFVSENRCLGICGDLCNGIKHLTLKASRGGECGEIKTKKVFVKFAGGTSLNVKIKFYVSTRTGLIDAFELATECLKKWGEFIEKNIECES